MYLLLDKPSFGQRISKSQTDSTTVSQPETATIYQFCLDKKGGPYHTCYTDFGALNNATMLFTDYDLGDDYISKAVYDDDDITPDYTYLKLTVPKLSDKYTAACYQSYHARQVTYEDMKVASGFDEWEENAYQLEGHQKEREEEARAIFRNYTCRKLREFIKKWRTDVCLNVGHKLELNDLDVYKRPSELKTKNDLVNMACAIEKRLYNWYRSEQIDQAENHWAQEFDNCGCGECDECDLAELAYALQTAGKTRFHAWRWHLFLGGCGVEYDKFKHLTHQQFFQKLMDEK